MEFANSKAGDPPGRLTNCHGLEGRGRFGLAGTRKWLGLMERRRVGYGSCGWAVERSTGLRWTNNGPDVA